MRLRALYALNGVVWGLLVGLGLGVELFALLAGFSWIYLFGDDAWPDLAAWYLTAAPLIGALAGLGVCVALGYSYGRRREAADEPEAARRLGRLVLFTGLVAWLLIGGTAVFLDRHQRATRDLALGRECKRRPTSICNNSSAGTSRRAPRCSSCPVTGMQAL